MDINAFVQSAAVTLTAVAWKVAGALALWLVGRWLIGLGAGDARKALRDRSSTPRSPATCRPASACS